MSLRRFTEFVLRSRLNAVLAAFLLSFIPLIGASISILIATLVTLRKGALEGTIVLVASLAPFLINYMVAPVPADAHMLLIATLTVIAINILTWLLALILRSYANWSLVVEVAAFVGIVLVGCIHYAYPEIQDWWSAQLTAYFSKTSSLLGSLTPDDGSSASDNTAAAANIVANVKQYATGFIVASVMFNALLQLILARWWQAVMFNPGELRKELHQIRLSYISVVIFAVISIGAYLGNSICLDFTPVMMTAFCAAGLSMIHYVVLSRKANWFWLAVVYMGIMFVFPLGMALIAIAGLFDSLLDLRKRLG